MLSESERALAIREGHRNAADAAYFNERPHLADDNGIRVFDAGFDRGWDAACAERDARIAEQDAVIAKLRLEAQIHAQEARTANATIAEIYQSVTGGTGEPGNWHGAAPIKARIAELAGEVGFYRTEGTVLAIKNKELEQQKAELEKALEEARKDAELLDWMIFYSARLGHGSDGEFCQCIWINEDGEQRTKLFGNARDAIRAAIKEQT